MGSPESHIYGLVVAFDSTTITINTTCGEVIVSYGDFPPLAYISSLLQVGMKVNVIPQNSTVQPGFPTPVKAEIVVIEPDFLMETSQVAACFAHPDQHPLSYTIRRMLPRPLSQAILLGNFAGTALHDILSTPAETYNVTQSIRRSFRSQALQFCACPQFDGAKFTADARQQADNLQKTAAILPQLSPPPSGGQGSTIVESTFLCPALGLMGRVDLMTPDMKLLIEQKSGRNMRIEQHAAVSARDDHYIQLLLYYGILRYNFNLPVTYSDIRLLYSKYPPQQGLLRAGFSHQRFHHAIRMRNILVAWERHIACHGFSSVMPTIAASDNSLSSLTNIEKQYFSRMMTFVYREQFYTKAGYAPSPAPNPLKVANKCSTPPSLGGRAASDLWNLTLSQKLQAGTIIFPLTITSRETDSADNHTVTLTLSTPPPQEQEASESIFRPGDPVYLYIYKGSPDITAAILYKATIRNITPPLGGQGTSVILSAPDCIPTPDLPLSEDRATFFAMEPAPADTTTNSQIRSLYQFITSPLPFRQLILCQRSPRADKSRQLSRSYHPHYDHLLLRAIQALDYFLIVGPPGTGKTSMAMRFLAQELQHTSLLFTAYTNRAVDEICSMLQTTGIQYLRLGNNSSLQGSDKGGLQLLKAQLQKIPIVVATTSYLQSQPAIFQIRTFSTVIVDEASQLTDPAIVGLLAQAAAPFILIGDHKQLPPVVVQPEEEAAVIETELLQTGISNCRESLFQRLVRWERRQQRTDFIATLHRQGRMHPDIASFPSHMFYADEQLIPAGLPHQTATTLGYDKAPLDSLDKQLQSRRVLFIPTKPTKPTEPTTPTNQTNTNPAEAALVANLLKRLHRLLNGNITPDTVGVIVPYRSQIAAIRHFLSQPGMPPLPDITIDTVERYQGSQRDIIIYSFTATQQEQLQFLTSATYYDGQQTIDRRLNVVMTRARKQLLMTGCPDLLCQNPIFRQLIRHYAVSE
ncbi:MAG: DNA2/NAM7 family helicase [Prevotella sp.]|nr:DNA2/NAM7 family helicase [Prevotella sp.]